MNEQHVGMDELFYIIILLIIMSSLLFFFDADKPMQQ